MNVCGFPFSGEDLWLEKHSRKCSAFCSDAAHVRAGSFDSQHKINVLNCSALQTNRWLWVPQFSVIQIFSAFLGIVTLEVCCWEGAGGR